MLSLLHTADWHIGRTFGQFRESDAEKLSQDRITTVERLFNHAERYNVDAVLCAGDLFDLPGPDDKYWQAVRDVLKSAASTTRPIVLLPGSHDPLISGSVYEFSHEFRRQLPDTVHIVDDDRFSLVLKDGTLFSAPCKAHASDQDATASVPNRGPDDRSIRIGMVHGTASSDGDTSNHPFSPNATANKGLDYLAGGSNHSWKTIAPDQASPIVYPGTPEPMTFNQQNCGFVAITSIRRSGSAPKVRQEKVNRWVWRDEVVTSMQQLQQLATQDLKSTVMRIKLQMTIDMLQLETLEHTLNHLAGTDTTNAMTGAFICDRSELSINVAEWSIDNLDLPETIRATVEKLQADARADDRSRADMAKRSILILRKMLRERGVAH